MTRKLILVIVSVVVTTLLLAGAGTLTLATVRARATTEKELHAQVTQIATNIGEFLDVPNPDTAAGRVQLRNRLRLLRSMNSVLPLEDITVLVADAQGQYTFSELPPTITLTALEQQRLANGGEVSATRHKVAYAVAPGRLPSGRNFLVVGTRKVDAGLGAAVRLFLWAGAATILLGLAAAWMLGRRLTKPIRDASAAAHQIAAGQLSARVEQPPPERNDEVAELQRSINHMASTLERSRGLEQQFLLSVSHDLRTPLTSISGYAEAIDDGTIDPRRAAGVIRGESKRLERLVADLLDLAKLQAKSFTFQPVRMDLAAAVHTAVDGVASTRQEIAFHPFTASPAMVMADPDRVAQALANLTENAGKYARSTVKVAVHTGDGWATVTVDDDGPGIAPHDLPHVFERLYTARLEPQRKENSSGLGLAIVRELVTSMGGEVAAGNAPDGGARLSFRLPLVP